TARPLGGAASVCVYWTSGGAGRPDDQPTVPSKWRRSARSCCRLVTPAPRTPRRSVGGAAAAAPVPSARPAPSAPAPSTRARREGAATGSRGGRAGGAGRGGAGRRVRSVGSIVLPLSGALDSETSAPS